MADLRHLQCERFKVDRRLATESTANLACRDLEIAHVHAHHSSSGVSNVKVTLRTTPDSGLAVFLVVAGARVWFDVALMNHRRDERSFDDDIGFLKAFLHVAFTDDLLVRDV